MNNYKRCQVVFAQVHQALRAHNVTPKMLGPFTMKTASVNFIAISVKIADMAGASEKTNNYPVIKKSH